MTANTDTTRERNSSNDKQTTAETELADLTPKQQAIIIATLEHPDDSAVTIATRVGTAQSYPSQVVDTHREILEALQNDLEADDSLVDVIERELSDDEIIEIVERGLLDEINTTLTEKYTSDNERHSKENTSDGRDTPVDGPTTAQRSFMSAAPDNAIACDSDTYETYGATTSEINDEQTAGTQTTQNTGSDTNEYYNKRSKSNNVVDSDEKLWQWYDALTKKQRAIIDAIIENPGQTDTQIAEIASKKLPDDESVSRAYVSITHSEDAPFLEALQEHRSGIETQEETNSVNESIPEIRGKNNRDTQEGTGTSNHQNSSQSPIPVRELKRVRDRIAFAASVTEHEYVLQQDIARSTDGTALPQAHVSGTVAFARQTLTAINTLIQDCE